MAITINGTGTLTGVSVGGLPDGIVDTDMLAASAVTAAKASGSAKGITMVDSWVVTANFTANGSGDITSNWARHSAQSWVGNIGSAMTESSGIFTFPSTGMYMVIIDLGGKTGDGARTYCGMRQYYSTDGGTSYNTASSYYSQGYNTDAHFYTSGTVIYDVSSTSNNKIKFNVETANTATVFASASNKNTGVTFIRLGDT